MELSKYYRDHRGIAESIGGVGSEVIRHCWNIDFAFSIFFSFHFAFSWHDLASILPHHYHIMLGEDGLGMQISCSYSYFFLCSKSCTYTVLPAW